MSEISFDVEDMSTTNRTEERRRSVDADISALLGRTTKRRPAPTPGVDKDNGTDHPGTTPISEDSDDNGPVRALELRVPPVPDAGRELPLPLGPISFSSDFILWEQQPDEPSKAYAAFVTYRDMGPQKRSLRRAYFAYYGKDPRYSNYAPNMFAMWSKTFGWVERCRLYDQQLEQKQRKVLEGRRLDARIETAELGQSLRLVAQEALNGLREALYEDVEVEDPVTGEIYIEKRLRRVLKPSEIAQLADTGVKIERLALELGGGSGESDMGVTLNLGIRIDQGAATLRDEARRILLEQEKVVKATAQVLEAKVVEIDADES